MLPWLLVICGSLGLIAAGALMAERVWVLEDPTRVPICSINAVFSCGSVMTSPQASVFGIPNPIVGIAGFSVILTVGLGLLAQATFQRWFWGGMQIGTTFAFLFILWLIYQSVFRIQALCPYCLVVWAVTAPMFWYVCLFNLQSSQLSTKKGLTRISAWLNHYHSAVLCFWYLGIVMLVGWRFWL